MTHWINGIMSLCAVCELYYNIIRTDSLIFIRAYTHIYLLNSFIDKYAIYIRIGWSLNIMDFVEPVTQIEIPSDSIWKSNIDTCKKIHFTPLFLPFKCQFCQKREKDQTVLTSQTPMCVWARASIYVFQWSKDDEEKSLTSIGNKQNNINEMECINLKWPHTSTHNKSS